MKPKRKNRRTIVVNDFAALISFIRINYDAEDICYLGDTFSKAIIRINNISRVRNIWT